MIFPVFLANTEGIVLPSGTFGLLDELSHVRAIAFSRRDATTDCPEPPGARFLYCGVAIGTVGTEGVIGIEDGTMGPTVEGSLSPFAFLAFISTVYCLPFISPINRNSLDTSAIGVYVPPFIEYSYVTGPRPPSSWDDRGMVIVPFPRLAVPNTGAPGTVEGVMGPTPDAPLRPFAFLAFMSTVYDVPFVSPVKLNLVGGPGISGIGVYDPPPFIEYSYVTGLRPPSFCDTRSMVIVPFPAVAVPKTGGPGAVEGIAG